MPADLASPDLVGDAERRRTAADLGIWLFLATEVLFFGGLVTSYVIGRTLHPAPFIVAARETDLTYGTLNTAILLTSSLLIALAVKLGRAQARQTRWLVLATVLLGAAFLAVKALEYYGDILEGLVPGPAFPLQPPAAQMFWALYWLMTGVHALHVIAGMAVLSVILALDSAARLDANSPALETAALYWHLVDVIWIFLYPMLYLVGRSA